MFFSREQSCERNDDSIVRSHHKHVQSRSLTCPLWAKLGRTQQAAERSVHKHVYNTGSESVRELHGTMTLRSSKRTAVSQADMWSSSEVTHTVPRYKQRLSDKLKKTTSCNKGVPTPQLLHSVTVENEEQFRTTPRCRHHNCMHITMGGSKRGMTHQVLDLSTVNSPVGLPIRALCLSLLAEINSPFQMGCSTKCALLRWSRGCQSLALGSLTVQKTSGTRRAPSIPLPRGKPLRRRTLQLSNSRLGTRPSSERLEFLCSHPIAVPIGCNHRNRGTVYACAIADWCQGVADGYYLETYFRSKILALTLLRRLSRERNRVNEKTVLVRWSPCVLLVGCSKTGISAMRNYEAR